MTICHTKRLLSLVSLSLIPLTALAQAATEASYYYWGGSVGQSRSNLDEESMTQQQLAGGLAVTNISRDDTDAAYKFFGGYQFSRYYGMEVGYFHLGSPNFSSTTTPSGTLNGDVKMRGFNIDLTGTMPISQALSLIGRVGYQYARTAGHFNGTGAVVPLDPGTKDNNGNYKVGAGLQYEVNPSVLIRGEWEHYRVSDAMTNHIGVNVASISLVFPFGRSPKTMQSALNTISLELGGAHFDMPNVEGRTDRIGTADYKQSTL